MDVPWGELVRLTIIFTGFIAVWSLWRARRERKTTWTFKMKGIWAIQIGWPLATIQANIELFYREVTPSFALFWVFLLMVGTIYFALREEPYLKPQNN